jgi:hypothetical protein
MNDNTKEADKRSARKICSGVPLPRPSDGPLPSIPQGSAHHERALVLRQHLPRKTMRPFFTCPLLFNDKSTEISEKPSPRKA